MTDVSIPVGSSGKAAANAPLSYNPIVGASSAGNYPPGTPVAPSPSETGAVVPANAHVSSVAFCAGFSTGAGVVGSRALTQFAGLVSLTPAEWDAVTGSSGGLTQGALYYLASDLAASAGRITSTPPVADGDFVLQVGLAMSPTDLLIQIGERVENT